MFKILVRCLFLTILFVHLDCEVYTDRPKIKTRNGDLILQPALDKNIIFVTNGPKSGVFVDGVNLLNVTSRIGSQGRPASIDDHTILNEPNDILKRLDRLESRNLELQNDRLNITLLWRRVNRLMTRVANLQNKVNNNIKDECVSRPCQNGGTCLNLASGYHCLCPSNWEGTNCDVDVNECRNFAGTDLGCQNGATCINRPGSYECICRSGWFGTHCTRKAKDCIGGDFEMCGHGTCIPVATGEGIKCICDQGWTTNGTSAACLTDVNECESSQGFRCSINPRVECINLPGSFRCGQCPSGFEGDGYICSDIDECVSNIPNGGCSTDPMVPCHNTIGSRICGSCPPGYQGDGITCTWRGSCSIDRGGCHPSAQCIDNPSLGGQIAQCICPAGMEGDGVGLQGCYVATRDNSTKRCQSSTCGAHGRCHPLRNGYTCICYRGYGGAHCEHSANSCDSSPCLNGGSCRVDTSSIRGFRCECTAQYSGDVCQVASKTCGGLLQAEEGSIVYPSTNSTYDHNSRCAWVIQTDRSKVINVTFSKFNIESHPDCLYDFLQIHDGRSSASQFLGRFCGNDYPKGGNIISTHNNLYFWFRSDQTVAKYGFALHWTSIDPVCGGEINASTHGHISSPGSPGKYPPNRDCYWRLTTSLGKRIQLHFFALDIEEHANCGFDYVEIYDGERSTDPLLSRFCNSTQPPPLQSSGSVILIHFHSDSYGSGNGFQMTFAPTEGVPGCGGLFTADKGDIVSPTYDGKYLPNLSCEYKIKTTPDNKIRIIFESFELERQISCKFDYLKVYDGPTSDSRLVGKFCGSTYPKSYISSSNSLYIKFQTDMTTAHEGFRIKYETVCQQTIVGDSGVVKSPGYPFAYPENKICEYVIATSPGKSIQLTFQDFDIEDNRYYSCRYDNVEIRDGLNINATLLGKYCGPNVPPVQISTHNYMYLRFNSDMSVSGTGFYANFTTIATKCGGIYRETAGIINHPSKEHYDDNESCTWILIAPEGRHIKLQTNRFDVENMPSCNGDYLEVIEIDENNENNVIGKYCGTQGPPALTSSTNRLMLMFVSDHSVQSTGFSISYSFLDGEHCGGSYSKSHGTIYSPGWPKSYGNNRECIWTISAPIGQQIKINISQFELERPIGNKCDFGDYLEIRNGPSQTSPLIGKQCGAFKWKTIISTGNTLYLHFHSDQYLAGKGFQIEWDSTITGCGGILTSPTGTISSPNYPARYNDNAECFYKIITSAGSRIHFVFTDLELEQTADCKDDYIQIFDGRDVSAQSLGKYCSMSPLLNRIETSSNFAFIKFRSDFFLGAKGFLLEYRTICQNNLTGTYGVIESPGYPNNYQFNLNCLWTINVSKGNKINITFTHFNLFQYQSPWLRRSYNTMFSPFGLSRLWDHQSCPDYLQVKDSSDGSFSPKYCGQALPPRMTSKNNYMQIKFTTGGASSNSGFRLEWARYGCGGLVQKKYGSISVDKLITSGGEIECEWTIEGPPGSSVSLFVSSLHVTESANCTIDAIEVYNGPNINTPLLTKICHTGAGFSRVQSTTNYMFIKFVKRSTLKDVHFTSNFDTYRVGCGARIEALSGFIHSNNYPKNYDNNIDCMWTLAVPRNHRIELNFMDLDLYSLSDTDCGDSIQIYDGNVVLNTNYTHRICPQNKVTSIISKNNYLGVQFTTDASNTAKGFKANFTVTCGATINGLFDGTITSDKFVRHFNRNCTWTILAPSPDQKISLTLTHMSIPRNADIITNRRCPSSFLRVFDGNDERAPLVDEFCGRKVPPMIVSRGSAVTIQLGSYNDSNPGQFSAHYSSLISACGGSLTSEEGTIASPNYPLSYPVSANCEWILNTSPGNRVYITFQQFDLEYSENCNEDYLEVRESNGAGKLLGVYCGSEIPTNTTTASKLYIKFHSDNKSAGRGFLIHYGFLHGNVITGTDSGEITSPLYPFHYEGAGEYSWRVATGDKETIVVNVDQMEIPSHGAICVSSLVIYDGYDEDAPVLQEFCGLLERRKVLQTSSNVVFIKMTLDDSNSGSFFHIHWTKQNKNLDSTGKNKKNCGSNDTHLILPGQSFVFHSPNYPEMYNSDSNCEWVFQATPGHHLKIHFDELKFEQTPLCFADSISIYSSENSQLWKPVKENLCLTEEVSQDVNSSTYMKIRFRTDSSITQKGFQAQVMSVCGGIITGNSGVVGPVWADLQRVSAVAGDRCEWTVKVRPGRVIKCHFEHFNITNKNDDCNMFVTLRNGDSKDSPLLGNGKFCGFSHENLGDLETSSNALFISYRYVNTPYQFKNFRLRYEEKNFECGVTSQLDSDHTWEVISSPNYPSVPVPYSECVWVFNGPPGEILKIDFLDRFDLESKDDCRTEFVEVRDGSSDLSPVKGRFCIEKPGSLKSSSNALNIKYFTQSSEPRNGFKANVSIDTCGGTITGSKGELISPGYPHMLMMPMGAVCEWRLIGWDRRIFQITPQEISLPESESPCATKITIEESMPINNTVTILQTFCSDQVENYNMRPILSSSNKVVIKLHIGKPSAWSQISESKGFRLTYNSSQPTCGGTVTTSEGYLTTPGYPRATNMRYCQWQITVPDKTRRVRLELLDSDLDKHKIGVFNDVSFQSVVQTLPTRNSSETSQVFESSGHKMALYLWLDALASQHRFKAKFSSDEDALCGGDLSGSSGELVSPDLDRSYTCEWHFTNRDTINSTEFNTIFITATVNSSVSRTMCRFSDPKLTINSRYKLRGISYVRNLCGKNEVSFTIPSTVMDLKATKNKLSSLYFHLNWKLQPCGGVIPIGKNPTNIIKIPESYNDSLDCAWVLIVPSGSRVEIKLDGAFKLDCADEFIKVNQGVDQNSPVLADYCKDKMQENPIITSYGFMFIQYHSSVKNNTNNVELTAKTVNNQCGGYMSMYDYMIESPNYPNNYEPNQECTWEIKAELGSRISLHFFDRFVIEDRVNCSKDAVIIYDWKDDTYTEIARVCGRQLPPIYNSTFNQMKIVLRTDADINLDGFKAMWVPICGGSYEATEIEQYIYSPGYPDQYSASLDCTYEIRASNKRLLLNFLDFELEGTYPSCAFDNVTISAMSDVNYSFMQMVYCGSTVPGEFNDFQQATINFKTDKYIQRKGFKLSYKIFACGGIVKEPTTLSSGPSASYGNNMNCTWQIEAPLNKLVVLKFQYIDLESTLSCYNDYLAIFNGMVIDDDKRLALICGKVNSTVLRSSGNTMLLQFVSDSSLALSGFKVAVLFSYSESVGCGGQVDLHASTSHTLKSPLIGNNLLYENFLDCQWHVKAPAYHVVKIEFKSFHVAPCAGVNQTALGISKCDCDLLEVKDGINPDSLVIGTYCGHTLPPQLISSGNIMAVRLSTDGEIDSSGFEALLSVLPSTCGQSFYSVTDSVQRIRSPGFESGSIPRGLHCVYNFYSNKDDYKTVRLTLKTLDLKPGAPNANECNQDRLIISNVPTVRNSSLGKDFMMSQYLEVFFNRRGIFEDTIRTPAQFVLCGNKHSIDYYFVGSTSINLITGPEADSLIYKGVEIEIVHTGFCGRNYTEPFGRIVSPYQVVTSGETLKDCYTLITAPENNTVSIHFLSVVPDFWNQEIYLDIFDGDKSSSNRLLRIDGAYDDSIPVFSTGRYVLLHSHMELSNRVTFELNYLTTDKGSGCGGKLLNVMGRVTSPKYPAIYRNKGTCEWELETPHNSRIMLRFSAFDLGRDCDNNYLQLVDRSGAVVSSFCGEIPADYTSADNYVKLAFTTTMNNGGVGWVVDFIATV